MLAWTVDVIDKETGSHFQLRVEGPDADACAPRLFALGFAVGGCQAAPELKPDPVYREHAELLRKLGYGKSPTVHPQGALARACAADDLETLKAALAWESHPIDRHFMLQRMVRCAYTIGSPGGASKMKMNSKTPPADAWRMVEPFGWQWIVESPAFRPFIVGDYGSVLGITVCDDLRKHLQARGFDARAEFVVGIEDDYYGRSDDDLEDEPEDDAADD